MRLPTWFSKLFSVSRAGFVVKEQTRSLISLRQLMEKERTVALLLLREYYSFFCEAFPFASEREELAVYQEYLQDPEFDWEILVFMEDDQVIGGVQFQHLAVDQDCVVFAEHFWLRKGYRNAPNFNFLGRYLESIARKRNAAAIVWECNDLRLMTPFQQRIDRKAGLSTEKRNVLWGRFGRVLDIYYAQPRLAPTEDPVEFLMLCIRTIRPGFQVTGKFYRTLFRNFVESFNEEPDSDETFQEVMERSMEFADNAIVPEIPFTETRRFLKEEAAAA